MIHGDLLNNKGASEPIWKAGTFSAINVYVAIISTIFRAKMAEIDYLSQQITRLTI